MQNIDDLRELLRASNRSFRMGPTMTARFIFAALIAAAGNFVVADEIASAQAPRAEDRNSRSELVPEINITSDSAPGWLPSVGQRQGAVKAANDYFAMLDAAQYARAYAMMAEINRMSVSFPEYTRRKRDFQEKSGPLKRRDILKVTWTKDPAAAPFPGVYAAIDIAASYGNVDRHCGFVVLYQKSTGDDFEVMREESNFIDNATAQNIERKQSRAALDSMWAKLAMNCPNFRPAATP